MASVWHLAAPPARAPVPSSQVPPGCPGFSLAVSLTVSHCLPFSVAPCLCPPFGLCSPHPPLAGLLLEEPRKPGLRAMLTPLLRRHNWSNFQLRGDLGFFVTTAVLCRRFGALEVDTGHVWKGGEQVGGCLHFENSDPTRHSLSPGEQSWSLCTFQGSSRMLLPEPPPPGLVGAVAPDKMQTPPDRRCPYPMRRTGEKDPAAFCFLPPCEFPQKLPIQGPLLPPGRLLIPGTWL